MSENENIEIKKWIRKDNWLIQQTTNKFTHKQNQILAILLSNFINVKDGECIDTSIAMADVLKIMQLDNSGKNYDILRKEVNNFGEHASICYIEKTKTGKDELVWMPYFKEIRVRENEVVFKWNDEMKPHLLEAKKKYTKYLSNHYLHLRSIYSQNLYELLKSLENYEKTYNQLPRYPLSELKKILKVEKKYKEFRVFNESCLKRAVKEINEITDLDVETQIIRVRRKAVGVAFKIRKKADVIDKENAIDNKKYEDNFVLGLFANEFNRELTEEEAQKVIYWNNTVNGKMLIYALRRASAMDKLHINYIETILDTWKTRNVSLDDIENGRA